MECSNCGLPVRKDNRTGVCTRTGCLAAYHRARYQNDPENGKARSRKFTENRGPKLRTGMSREEYASRLESQGNCCAICGKTATENGRHLAVDHDHRCCPQGISCENCRRDLLCHRCNRVLGMLNDDPDLLIAMAAYLIRHEVSERI